MMKCGSTGITAPGVVVLMVLAFAVTGCAEKSGEAAPPADGPAERTADGGPGTASVFRGTYLRSGIFDALPIRSLPSTVWTFGSAGSGVSAVVCTGEHAYFGSEDGYVYQLELDSGKIVWRFQTAGNVDGAPTPSGNRVYAGSADGRMHCIDTRTGELLWDFKAGAGIRSSPIVEDGRLVFSDDSGNVYALEAETGAEIWKTPTGGPLVGSPSADGTNLFVSGTDGNLRVLDMKTGTMIRLLDPGIPIPSSPAGIGNILFVAGTSGKLAAVSTGNGSVLWEFGEDSFPGQAPAVTETAVFYATAGGELFAFETGTGKVLWRNAGFSGFSAPPSVAGTVVYVPEQDSRISAFDAASGKLLWAVDTPAPVGAPVAAFENKIVFGDVRGTITAMTGLQSDPAPVYSGRDDAMRTGSVVPESGERTEGAAMGSPGTEASEPDDASVGTVTQENSGTRDVLVGDGKIRFYAVTLDKPLRLEFRPEKNGVYEFSLPKPGAMPVVLKLLHRSAEMLASNLETDRLENSFTFLVRKDEEYALTVESLGTGAAEDRISLRIRLIREE